MSGAGPGSRRVHRPLGRQARNLSRRHRIRLGGVAAAAGRGRLVPGRSQELPVLEATLSAATPPRRRRGGAGRGLPGGLSGVLAPRPAAADRRRARGGCTRPGSRPTDPGAGAGDRGAPGGRALFSPDGSRRAAARRVPGGAVDRRPAGTAAVERPLAAGARLRRSRPPGPARFSSRRGVPAAAARSGGRETGSRAARRTPLSPLVSLKRFASHAIKTTIEIFRFLESFGRPEAPASA